MSKALLITILLLPFVMFGQEMEKDTDGCNIFRMPEGDTVYTMKQYYMVFYKVGTNRDQNKEDINKIQSGHMDHINRMAEAGVLSIAGPFGHDGDLSRILIFNVPEEEHGKFGF